MTSKLCHPPRRHEDDGEIPWSAAGAAVMDMLGNVKRIKPAGGKLTVEVGPCPIYITADRKEAAK